MKNYNNYQKVYQKITEAEAIVIGAGSGLSAAAGLTYSGERFKKYFRDYIDHYYLTDMYSAGFYPFDSLETYWVIGVNMFFIIDISLRLCRYIKSFYLW